MSKLSKILILSFSVHLLLNSCKSKKGLFRNKNTAKSSQESIKNYLKDSIAISPKIKFLSFKLNGKYECKERNLPIKASVRIYKDSLIWASITPLLGIEVARVLATTDSVFVINRLQSQVMKGSVKNFTEQYNISNGLESIINVILGRAFLPDTLVNSKTMVRNKDTLSVLTTFNAFDIKTNLPDTYNYKTNIIKKEQKIVSQNIAKHNKSQSLGASYSDFQNISFENGVFAIPFQQSFHIFDGDDIKIEGKLSKMDTAKCMFPFNISKKYEVVYF